MSQLLQFLQGIVTLNNSFIWDAVWANLFATFLLHGVILTVVLAVVSQVVGTLIGLLLYFMRRAPIRIVRRFVDAYVWFFRGTPLLAQILLLYTLLPYLHISRPLRQIDPFTPLGFQGIFLDSFLAAGIALSLNEGAYMAEIVRAGIDSIDVGQIEAAKSLGMTYLQGMRRIVLPQAMRVIIPPLGNEFNNMLKTTSLASVISLNELLGSARLIGTRSFTNLELLIAASLWYLVMTSVWGVIQSRIERRFNASNIDPGSTLANVPWWRRFTGTGAPSVVVAPVAGPVAGTLPDRR